ncbi:terminase large subunit domain-containing protein [Pelagibacterium halotolerans]|uniref:Phage terminase, large subunit n=1 Tax=Pelagibacterium halotolerans (strain DSM 22347 / JCM 15775 / CGMCC 1.7692 / B2) TaxID=1082931 RepID=G4RDD7_PELHB|nr:terminase family protein [Pelagibacterium halotolerans]AEQ50763.1 phage terminase, large subunit [Pelagibacterium halotolerans B2]QJR19318.1 terminase [Pelagibacterium halotolerans]SDZ95182.1 Mu-like prophage FluMu protein gp28 [Pelagibacterium halotolerans]
MQPLLYGYQQRWFADRSRFKMGKFARQTGKTFTTTLECVDDCFEHVVKSRKTRWVILSRGERQAREAMHEGVFPHAKAYGLAFTEAEFDWIGDGGSYRALEVELPHGSKITALPANPDTARGFSSNVFLDEFAFHKDSNAIWKALFPVISAGWKLRVTSTPNGKSGKFYELDTAEDDAWSRHVVDIYQAVADGLPRDIDELRAGIADEDAWAQEYELRYLDEASAWLSYALIASCEDDDAGHREGYQGGPCYVGRDIGRRNDLHVIYVLELIGDVLWERERIEQKRATFADMDMAFDDVMTRYHVARACIDQTGMGEKVVEDAQRRYGGRIEGVLFTSSSKLVMATQGKERFEDRRVRIKAGDVPLRSDLHKLRKISGPTGAPRFVAERDDDHADRTWALFLGINAAAGMDAAQWRPLSPAAAQDKPAAERTLDDDWIPA